VIRHIIRATARIWVFCLVATGLNISCVNFTTQGRQDSTCWGGYSAGQRLQLLQACFIARVSDGVEGCRYILLPQGQVWTPGRLHPAPEQISSWNKGKTNEWRYPGVDISRVVPIGTVIAIRHLKVNRGWSWWAGRHIIPVVYGQIMEGEHHGQFVDMSDVSVLQHDGRSRGPNPVLFRPAPQVSDQGSAAPPEPDFENGKYMGDNNSGIDTKVNGK